MFRFRLILFFFLFPLVLVQAQYPIKIRIDSMPNRKAFLLEYIGVTPQLKDSANVNRDGSFEFILQKDAHPGMYRVIVGPNDYWDILFNREPIEMRTHFSALVDSLRVIRSIDNVLLKEYMTWYINLNRKAESLQQLLRLYPASDPFYRQVMSELQKLNSIDRDQIGRDIIARHPETYVARFLKTELSPQVPSDIPPNKELPYVLEHFFDNIDFTDTALLYSPPLVGKIRTFFSLFPQAYPPLEVEPEMKKGLDRLMSLAAVNDVIFQYVLEDISNWAERSEFEDFFAYLTEFYLTEAACKDEERAGEIGEILESIKKTAIGSKAPEIILPMEDGEAKILSEIPARYKLVIFWASWCPHCNEMLPAVHDIYQRYKNDGLEVMAISIDNSRAEWQAALQKHGFTWIDYSELKGWDCSIAHDYGIRATPTIILMSRDRTIVAKPRNPQMLEDQLKQLGMKASR